MKTVTNKTHKPLKLPLPGGKVLHLGPKKSGQIADGAVDAPAIARFIKSGDLEVQEDGSGSGSGGGRGRSGSGQSANQGHTPTKIVRPSGDR